LLDACLESRKSVPSHILHYYVSLVERVEKKK
jgi:hypothetical protein